MAPAHDRASASNFDSWKAWAASSRQSQPIFGASLLSRSSYSLSWPVSDVRYSLATRSWKPCRSTKYRS